jgi:hypothetical protein
MRPAGDAPGAVRVAIPAQAMRLFDLPAELLMLVVAQLRPCDELATLLACRKLRKAVAATERRATGAAVDGDRLGVSGPWVAPPQRAAAPRRAGRAA